MASFKYVLFFQISFILISSWFHPIYIHTTNKLAFYSINMFIQQCSLLFLHNNHSSPHIKNTQLIYNNTNNKNIFYHYIFHKTYTHTILISSKYVFNHACYILSKLAIDSKGNKSSTSDYCFKPNGKTTYHRVVHNISQNHNDPTVKSPQI